jgi:hypothetical protein
MGRQQTEANLQLLGGMVDGQYASARSRRVAKFLAIFLLLVWATAKSQFSLMQPSRGSRAPFFYYFFIPFKGPLDWGESGAHKRKCNGTDSSQNCKKKSPVSGARPSGGDHRGSGLC